MQDSDLVAGETWSQKHILAILKGSRSHAQLPAKPRLSGEPLEPSHLFVAFVFLTKQSSTTSTPLHTYYYYFFHRVIILPLALLFPVYL